MNHLIAVFRSAEQNKDMEKLTLLFKIFRQLSITLGGKGQFIDFLLVNLAHYELYQVLLSDEYYLEVFGALEC